MTMEQTSSSTARPSADTPGHPRKGPAMSWETLKATNKEKRQRKWRTPSSSSSEYLPSQEGSLSPPRAERQQHRHGERKARHCTLCSQDFKYLRKHLMGSKHGLSRDAASRVLYDTKETTKPRFPCPFAKCSKKGVRVQKLNRHLRKVHGLDQEALKAMTAGLSPQDLRAKGIDLQDDGSTISQQEEEEPAAPTPEDLPAAAAAAAVEEEEEDEDHDTATLDRFKSFLCSLDGGSHPARTADQSASVLGRMADSAGGLRSIVLDPMQLSREGGFLKVSTTEKAPGTVKTYLLALKQFGAFASAVKLYPQEDVQCLLSQIPVWQTSLKKLARHHDQKRRLSDESRVEEVLAKESEGGETEDARLGRQLLSADCSYEDASLSQFFLARDYMICQTLQNNIQRSGSAVNLTWEEVDGERMEDGHHVVRTFNKTLGVHGLTNLVFDDERFRMLERYRKLQAAVVGPDVALVFTTGKGNSVQHNHISRALEKVIGTPATATLLRKSAVVSWSQTGGDMDRLSQQMKHSKETQRQSYATFNDCANSVEVFKDQQSRVKWTKEQEDTLRRNMCEYISAGGVRKKTVETIIQVQPHMTALAKTFSIKQIQDKVRSLHKAHANN